MTRNRPRPMHLTPMAALFAIGLTAAADAQVTDATYTGSWTNTTFGSTGSAQFIVEVTGSNVTVTMDLGCSVFGNPTEPTPLVMTGTINPGGTTVSDTGHPTYGDTTANVDTAGNVTGTAINVPGFVESTDVTGTINATTIDLDYTVHNSQGPFADGIINAQVPEPATAALLVFGSVGLLYSRPRPERLKERTGEIQ